MYVSVWKRFWAFLIDAAVFAVLFWALAQLINGWTVSLILLFIIWLYYAWLESSPWQASLGKRVMGLKVVDKRGRRLSFWKASKRLLTRIGTNLTFYFGFFTAAWDKHHETLHDHLSKSVVIAKDAEFDPEYYHDPGDHALTLVTVVSVILAVIFVVGLLAWVVLPQYQRIGDSVNAAHIIDNLNAAAANRPARLQAAGPNGPEIWLKSYSGCVNDAKDPLTLDCNGYRMTLQPDGISAVTRLSNWDEYTLFKSYQTGHIACLAHSKRAIAFCQGLELP
ncbi:RDD family protein [Candidatus Avelusimicrobium facis]|uniref:RDD family protein n=1 Tax=Candidatus Avelusimicrobium facis TaxID=3416203 RepID=UPI003D121F73